MSSNLKKHFASIFVLLIFAFLAVGSTDTDVDTRKVQSQEPDYVLRANDLINEYDVNEVSADDKYKGKIVVVTGTIQSIGKDIMDQAYIVIGGEGFLDGIQCMFTKGEHRTIARLSKGQMVTVKGEVRGKSIGNVLMEKCHINRIF